LFRRPTVSVGLFSSYVGARCGQVGGAHPGGLFASQARLVGHGLSAGSSQCAQCGAEVEDEEHMVLGCPATGPQDWGSFLAEAWRVAGRRAGLEVGVPAMALLECYRFQLVAALIPRAAAMEWGLPPAVAPRFLAALHRSLAKAVAERSRRREQLRVEAAAVPASRRVTCRRPGQRVLATGAQTDSGGCAGVGAGAGCCRGRAGCCPPPQGRLVAVRSRWPGSHGRGGSGSA